MAKTGGLADVSAALPAALRDHGVDVRVLVPAYPQVLAQAPNLREVLHLGDPLGYGDTRLLETYLPTSKLPVWAVDCPNLYNRSGGLYQDENGCDWPDNDRRFALLNYVAAAIANELSGSWQPDIIHANDWHAGLVPLCYRADNGNDLRPCLRSTISPIRAFSDANDSAIGPARRTTLGCGVYGRISFLKAGICSADAITTVSPTYAKRYCLRNTAAVLTNRSAEKHRACAVF